MRPCCVPCCCAIVNPGTNCTKSPSILQRQTLILSLSPPVALHHHSSTVSIIPDKRGNVALQALSLGFNEGTSALRGNRTYQLKPRFTACRCFAQTGSRLTGCCCFRPSCLRTCEIIVDVDVGRSLSLAQQRRSARPFFDAGTAVVVAVVF